MLQSADQFDEHSRCGRLCGVTVASPSSPQRGLSQNTEQGGSATPTVIPAQEAVAKGNVIPANEAVVKYVMPAKAGIHVRVMPAYAASRAPVESTRPTGLDLVSMSTLTIISEVWFLPARPLVIHRSRNPVG